MSPYLVGGGSDIYTFAVLVSIVEGEVEQSALFDYVAGDIRVHHESLQANALPPVNMYGVVLHHVVDSRRVVAPCRRRRQ